ncbi:MAG: hypothetical protein MUO82_08825 [Candidatus Thermoplasmatota archaeon]|nr:hypothetical protein [Candidatus Thermoplasmatota archaeon]
MQDLKNMLFGKNKPKKEKKERVIYSFQHMFQFIDDFNNPEDSLKKTNDILIKVSQAKREGKNEHDLLTDEEIQMREHMKKNVKVKKKRSCFK